MASTYRIIDEPRPSAVAQLAVSPFWIFLSLMLGGAWIGLPWFALNAFAIGSSNRNKELAWCAAALLGSAALMALGTQLVSMGYLDRRSLPYAATVLILWKLGVGYLLHTSQAVSHELFVYFGGVSRNGLPVALGAMLARPALLGTIEQAFWVAVLA